MKSMTEFQVHHRTRVVCLFPRTLDDCFFFWVSQEERSCAIVQYLGLNCIGPLFPWIYVSHLCAVRHYFQIVSFPGISTCWTQVPIITCSLPFKLVGCVELALKKNSPPTSPFVQLLRLRWSDRSNWRWVELTLKSWYTPGQGEKTKQNKNKSEHWKVIMLLIFGIRS